MADKSTLERSTCVRDVSFADGPKERCLEIYRYTPAYGRPYYRIKHRGHARWWTKPCHRADYASLQGAMRRLRSAYPEFQHVWRIRNWF